MGVTSHRDMEKLSCNTELCLQVNPPALQEGSLCSLHLMRDFHVNKSSTSLHPEDSSALPLGRGKVPKSIRRAPKAQGDWAENSMPDGTVAPRSGVKNSLHPKSHQSQACFHRNGTGPQKIEIKHAPFSESFSLPVFNQMFLQLFV